MTECLQFELLWVSVCRLKWPNHSLRSSAAGERRTIVLHLYPPTSHNTLVLNGFTHMSSSRGGQSAASQCALDSSGFADVFHPLVSQSSWAVQWWMDQWAAANERECAVCCLTTHTDLWCNAGLWLLPSFFLLTNLPPHPRFLLVTLPSLH